jgi:hypothetical protein
LTDRQETAVFSIVLLHNLFAVRIKPQRVLSQSRGTSGDFLRARFLGLPQRSGDSVVHPRGFLGSPLGSPLFECFVGPHEIRR